MNKLLNQVIALKNAMCEAMDGNDEKFYESEFEVAYMHGGKKYSVNLGMFPETWELMEEIVTDIGDMSVDDDFYSVTEDEKIRWAKANNRDYTEYEYDYCEKSDKTYIMKSLMAWNCTERCYYLKSEELVGWHYGKPYEDTKKHCNMKAEYGM